MERPFKLLEVFNLTPAIKAEHNNLAWEALMEAFEESEYLNLLEWDDAMEALKGVHEKIVPRDFLLYCIRSEWITGRDQYTEDDDINACQKANDREDERLRDMAPSPAEQEEAMAIDIDQLAEHFERIIAEKDRRYELISAEKHRAQEACQEAERQIAELAEMITHLERRLDQAYRVLGERYLDDNLTLRS